MKAWNDFKQRIAADFREKFWDSEQMLKARQKFV